MSGDDFFCLEKNCLFSILHNIARLAFWLSMIVFVCSLFGWIVGDSGHSHRYYFHDRETTYAITFLTLSIEVFFASIIMDGFAYIVKAAIKYIGDEKPEEKKEIAQEKTLDTKEEK